MEVRARQTSQQSVVVSSSGSCDAVEMKEAHQDEDRDVHEWRKSNAQTS